LRALFGFVNLDHGIAAEFCAPRVAALVCLDAGGNFRGARACWCVLAACYARATWLAAEKAARC
jgi:hypothetical protein